MAPQILSFGCRLNAAEGEAIRRHLLAAGRSGTIVLNSCTVTAEAEAQLGQAIRRARRAHPAAEIVVTGCAAQRDPARWAALPEVDRVVGNPEKLRAETWAQDPKARVAVGAPVAPPLPVATGAGHTRAFLTIQQGCDHACTFCVIPQARGPNRSLPAATLLAEARRLLDGGAREIVLTGVDIASWGRDLPGAPRLGDLAAALLAALPELPRLRLSTLDPAGLDEGLLALFAAEPRLMPHLHLSVQAGDDLILKRMKRRHLRADVIAAARRLRAARPDSVLGADLIAGFPTESEAAFQRTLDLVAEAGLTWLHVFPYSPRPGTPAARMPPLPPGVARQRAARLRSLGEAQAAAFLQSQIGRRLGVLVERGGRGYSEHYAPVTLDAPAGEIARARIEGVAAGRLVARRVELAA